MSGYQRIVNGYGEPVQQSVTLDRRDYLPQNNFRVVLGVVLSVQPADNEKNRASSQREDRRGYLHTATVLVVDDGRGGSFPLENVIITPDGVSGLDNYQEQLPRGSSSLVTGQSFNSQLNHIDPYTLDGDWCVVGFLGGSVDRPFILRYWPHAKNPFDPATSGQRNPNDPEASPTLNQAGRLFQRINGVEFTVTKTGNLYVSTYRANAKLALGENVSAEEGRFPRTLNQDEGGSIRVWVKPTQSFEMVWDPPVDGRGVLDIDDPEIPQTNPRTGRSKKATHDSTYLLLDQDRLEFEVPEEIKVLSKQRLLLESQEEAKITVGADLTTDVQGTLDVDVTSDLEVDVAAQTTLTGTGPVTIDAVSTLDVKAAKADITAQGALALAGATLSLAANVAPGTPGSLSVSPSGVTLGSGALGGAVGGTPLLAAITAYAAAVDAAAGLATVDTAAWRALATATTALASALESAVSDTTTVG